MNWFHLEIGCGKGDFLINIASKNNDIIFIGIEKDKVVLTQFYRKLINKNKAIPSNIILSNILASNIKTYIENWKIEKIYLNFSDPWPKKQHSNRRLVDRSYLIIFNDLLTKDGIIEIKTDNYFIYNYCLDEVKNTNLFNIIYKTEDLYNSEEIKNNVETEYEKKFVKQGIKIKKIILKK